MLIPSGNFSSQSTILLVLRRRESHFSLAVCNGDPHAVQQYHARHPHRDSHFSHAFIVEKIPREVLMDSSFWFMLCRPAVYPLTNTVDPTTQLYEVLLPYLNTSPLKQTRAAQPSHSGT